MRTLSAIVISVFFCGSAFAGGPAFVAGASYFDPAVKGTPVVWSQGVVSYYTDQGSLSPILSGPGADALVANAFSQWTSIPTVALSAIRAGQLAEDVSGTNVTIGGGQINLPSDIQPGAAGTPVGIVYDFDGSVTDALLGVGASNSLYCSGNSVFGGADNIATNAEFQHALIVINGKCASASSQLPDLQYHLVRVIGRVLGLDRSQANENVITRKPVPTAADYAGFPVMHQNDPPGCIPVTICYSNNGLVNPSQPKPDDQASLSRLYPVTAQNVASFPGKQILATNTARIRGTFHFDDGFGGPAQPMQGLNVVARWIDPSTGLASRSYVVTSISGFLFRGNAGNPVSGYTDSAGNQFDRYGSDDPALQGYFDLAGVPLPGGVQAKYQLSIEAVDPLWSANAGPYGSAFQVKPSGTVVPAQITVAPGSDISVDLVMLGSAVQAKQWYAPTSYASPAQVPASGSWSGVLAGTDFFQFPAQANRSLSVIVDALDESGNPSENKAMPVIGAWGMANPGQFPAPAYTPSSFNTSNFAETRLDAQVLQMTSLRVGIADYRGDARPDYAYTARVFYGDHITPSRASVAGSTPITISGFGLQTNTVAQIANVTVPVVAASATQLLVDTPPAPDGLYDLQLSDPKSGGSSMMSGVLTIGAGPSDTLRLISGAGTATPVGGQVNTPFAIAVLAPDGVTPVSGASVQFSSSPAVAFSMCGGASNCAVLSDQSGMASTPVTLLSTGVTTLTAKLAPASYARPQKVQATVLGISSALDLSLPTPSLWIAQGSTLNVPLTALVLSHGSGASGATLNFQITQGSGTLSSATAQTNASGVATANLQLSSLSATVQVSICVAPNNNPCQVFRAFAMAPTSLQLQSVSGTLQICSPGQSLQPVFVRVTDSSTPPHVVLGAGVVFQELIGRLPANQPIVWAGEAGIFQPRMPVVLGKSQTTVASDMNGLASFPISTQGFSGNIAVIGSAAVGSASLQFAAQQLGP